MGGLREECLESDKERCVAREGWNPAQQVI